MSAKDDSSGRGSRWLEHAAGGHERGFTIMEMMIVVAMIGLLLAAGTMTLRNVVRSDLRSAAARTAAAMRFAFDRATMTGNTIRLAFDMDKGVIWAEVSEDRVTLRAGREQHVASGSESGGEAPRKPKKPVVPLFAPETTGEGEEEGAADQAAGEEIKALTEEWEADKAPVARARARFQPLKTLLARKIKLASGISLSAVVTPRDPEPVEKGMAYVYFFPQGHGEPAIIHFVDRSDEYYSVVLHPLTGIARVYPCMYRIPADFGVSDDKRSRSGYQDPCAARSGI